MLKIGDFSKLTQVSIRMLRHYDELGLLTPAHIDRETAYRYYTVEQLPRLHRILALQDLGFSLKQVGSLLEQNLSPDHLRGMLIQKQAELEDHMRAEQGRLARVAARLSQIEHAGGDGGDVVIKQLPAQWVVSARDKITEYGNVGFLFDRLFKHLLPLGIMGLTASIWHDDSFVEEGIDAEALIFLSQPVPAGAEVEIKELPPMTVASVVHQGSYQRLTSAYNALLLWLDQSGYQIAGANREIYLHFNMPSRSDDESYLTEIQFPVALAADGQPKR